MKKNIKLSETTVLRNKSQIWNFNRKRNALFSSRAQNPTDLLSPVDLCLFTKTPDNYTVTVLQYYQMHYSFVFMFRPTCLCTVYLDLC